MRRFSVVEWKNKRYRERERLGKWMLSNAERLLFLVVTILWVSQIIDFNRTNGSWDSIGLVLMSVAGLVFLVNMLFLTMEE